MPTSNVITADFIIIGAGIIGLNIAKELKQLYPDSRIILIEKERSIGQHASGRNSGVLHAGFYYTKDSLKAKFTKLGNQALSNYCIEHNLPINRCGKLVVTRNTEDLAGLHELYRRAKQNDIPVTLISAQEATEIEPRVNTFEQALFSPTTASVNPKLILQHLCKECESLGIAVHLGVEYLSFQKNVLRTNRGHYVGRYIINSAGLYADKIARDFGFSKNFRILPFKGIYLYTNQAVESLRTHIYPVPTLSNPFLGVHFTLAVDGAIKIGPTAIPAFWREQYSSTANFQLKEFVETIWRQMGLFMRSSFNFKLIAWNEIKKYQRNVLITHAAELVKSINKSAYNQWSAPGIRAQLFNIKSRSLEMDFIIEGDDHSLHVLNAVSPAFTCSIPFAKYVVERIKTHIHP